MSLFFDDALGKVKNVADAAGKKTTDLVEFSKLKLALTDLNEEINRGYMRLGKITYERNTREGADEEAAAIIGEIDGLQEKLASIHDRILAIKNVVRCAECGAINPRQAVFCNQCGAMIKIAEPKPEEEPACEVGEAVEDVVDAAEDAVQDAVEEVAEGVEEAAEAVKDAFTEE